MEIYLAMVDGHVIVKWDKEFVTNTRRNSQVTDGE